MSFHEREHQDSEACEPESPEGRERNEMIQGSGLALGVLLGHMAFLGKGEEIQDLPI